MNNRERTRAVLHYEKYDRMPVVHFGYWSELLDKWLAEGHITEEERRGYGDGNAIDMQMNKRLGFDYGHCCQVGAAHDLFPGFEYKILEEYPDGSYIYQSGMGLIEKARRGATSIPMTVGTLLTDRDAWERDYKHRLTWKPERVNADRIRRIAARQDEYDVPFGIHVGSYYGKVRDMLGVENLAYLYADDEELYAEIIATLGETSYQNTKMILELGIRPDFAHYWEDICFKNGPLVSPEVFAEYVGPWYKKTTDLLREYGCDIVSLDCDGCIDKLVPVWLENGVNTMFPIEVGTWNASIAPWREKYGKSLRGIGGMDKRVFALDYAEIDKELERLKPLIELGGFIPCPDHRLPPETKWENVQYYCEQFRKMF
ncbi:MAG: hypothetical protein IJ497_04475 [Clostridia bacterium]|nr:hypothetical protein [Clostridia bacterium]